MKIENAKAQMKKGVLEMCILSILEKGEAYPPEISNILKEGQLIVVDGTLYPLLNRLKNEGLLTHTWRESTSGPPRKYYKLTETGRTVLHSLEESWAELTQSVEHLFAQGKKNK